MEVLVLFVFSLLSAHIFTYVLLVMEVLVLFGFSPPTFAYTFSERRSAMCHHTHHITIYT